MRIAWHKLKKLLTKTALQVPLLMLAVVALYGQFLWNPLVFDDRDFFLLDMAGNAPISSYQFSWLGLRAFPYETLVLTKDWFGLDLIGFRLGNLLLHAAVVITLYYLLRKLFSVAYGDRCSEGLTSRMAAFFAALLFALHPVATYAVGYLVQRSIVMATLFALLTMLAYVHGSLRQSNFWLWACVPLYYLSVFSKEHAIMLPALLVALTILLHEDWIERLKERWGIFAVLTAVAGFVILAKANLIGSVYEYSASEMLQNIDIDNAHSLSALTQSWLFFKYVFLWLFPNPAWMSVDMREPFASSFLSLYLVAAGGYLAWGSGAIWLLLKRGKLGLAGFALLFPWGMFWTEFSSVRIQESFVLYRSYLWVVGAFCLFPLVFERCNGRMAAFILSAIALAMMPISMDRLITFSHPISLWDDAEKLVKGREYLPGVWRIYYNRGTEFLKVDFVDQAIPDLKKAIALRGDFGEGYANLGAVLSQKGEWRDSSSAYSMAIEIFLKKGLPPQWKYFYGRAIAYENLDEMQKAQADYKVTCLLANKGCEKLPEGKLSSAVH